MYYIFNILWESFGRRQTKKIKIVLQENYDEKLEFPKRIIIIKPE